MITDNRRVLMPPLEAPNVGEFVIDPVFGSKIWRVTDSVAEEWPGLGKVTMYTGTRAWNADESLLTIYGQGEGGDDWFVYSGQPPFQFKTKLNLGKESPSTPEVIHWDKTDPAKFIWLSRTGRIYEWADGTTRVLADLSLKTDFGAVQAETHSGPSWDAKYWGLSYFEAARPTTNKKLVVMDLTTGQPALTLNYGDFLGAGPKDPGIAGTPIISASGKHAIIVVAGQFYVYEIPSGKLERKLAIGPIFEHFAIGQLSFGGVSLDMHYSMNQGTPKTATGSVPAHLYTAFLDYGSPNATAGPLLPRVKLPDGSFYWAFPSGVHLSALTENLVATSCFAPQSKTSITWVLDPGQQEIVVTDVLQTLVQKQHVFQRLCHHRSRVFDYWQEPHPTIAPSWRVAFTSNWSAHRTETAPKSDVFVVEAS